MLDPATTQDRLDFKYEFKLTEGQRALLASSVKQEHFDLLQRLMEDELKLFNVQLMNTPASKPEEVLINHVIAQSVTKWYVGFMKNLSEEVKLHQYTASGVGSRSNPEASAVEQDFQ